LNFKKIYYICKLLIKIKMFLDKINVAILGGAFNPIHKSHIDVAKSVLDDCKQINEVWITPCFTHKYIKNIL